MTIVGKILVFMNLVFSLVVGGLVMVVYMTSSNWEDAYRKKDSAYQAVDAERQQKVKALEDTEKDFNAKLKTSENKVKDLEKALDDVKQELDRKEKELAKTKLKDRNDATDVQVLQGSVGARLQLVKELEAANENLRKEKTQAMEEAQKWYKASIQSDVQMKTFQARATALEEQVRDLSRELIRSKAGPTGGFVVRKKGDENPPPDNVEGRVKEVDPEDGLVKLSIGSDAGLTQGHTLKVFRLHPVPEQSKYLGTIEILVVRPHEAVGRPVNRTSIGIRPGDRVASRLLVGGN